MKPVALNRVIPKTQLTGTQQASIDLSDYRGKKIVIYFYPKDNTSGCTKESESFRDHQSKFTRANTIIFGVSRDSVKSHQRFIDKLELPFDLISDPDEVLCEAFGVMKMKSMYGREYRGIERSTFLINEKGKLIKEWRNVKVPGHVEAVLEAVKGG